MLHKVHTWFWRTHSEKQYSFVRLRDSKFLKAANSERFEQSHVYCRRTVTSGWAYGALDGARASGFSVLFGAVILIFGNDDLKGIESKIKKCILSSFWDQIPVCASSLRLITKVNLRYRVFHYGDWIKKENFRTEE